MDKELNEMLRDLIWLQAVLVTEVIQITENTSSILRNAPPPPRCLEEHQALRATALEIAERWHPGGAFREHLTGHR